MDVRDGRADIDAVADFFGLSPAAAERLCSDRRVEVAVEDDAVLGASAYEVQGGVVHVTRLAGETEAKLRLLESPMRFAESESAPVETVVPEGEEDTESALRAAGFERAGSGPRFEGKPTVRYRYSPEGA